MIDLFKKSKRYYLHVAGYIAVLACIILLLLWSTKLIRTPLTNWSKTPGFQSGAGELAANVTESPSGIDDTAFKFEGNLAIIQNGKLEILEGKTGRHIQIDSEGTVLQPKWSQDGQWLAYLIVNQQNLDTGSLWVVKRDGTQSHPVNGLPEAVRRNVYKWSPTKNELAVSCQGIWLIDEQGRSKQVVKTGPDSNPDIAWSPDGQQIAYSMTLPYTREEVENRSDALYTLDIQTGQTEKRIITQAAGIWLINWWPDGKGVLYWEDPCHSASIAADGLELCSLPIGAKEPFRFSAGLTNRCWLSITPDDRLIRVAGTGRAEWTNKWLEICYIKNGTTVAFNITPGSVPTDLSFSVDGRQIAFVTAPDLGSDKYPNMDEINKWISSFTLWLANSDGSGFRPITQAGGKVMEPQWSQDGEYIMYTADNYLWIIDAQGNAKHKIAGPFSTDDKDEYYYNGHRSCLWAWYQG